MDRRNALLILAWLQSVMGLLARLQLFHPRFLSYDAPRVSNGARVFRLQAPRAPGSRPPAEGHRAFAARIRRGYSATRRSVYPTSDCPGTPQERALRSRT